MDIQNNNLQLSQKEKKISRYKSFWLLLTSILILTGIFLCWTLTIGKGEQNLGAWLILALPYSFLIVGLSVFLGLTFKFIFNRILNRKNKHPILIICVSTAVTTLSITYFIMSSIFDDSSVFLIVFGRFILIGACAFLIMFLSYLFKIDQPNIWKLNLGPAILTCCSMVILSFFIILGLNCIAKKLFWCDLIRNSHENRICYREKAIRIGDINLCINKDLDIFTKNDCLIGIAIEKKDVSICELSVIKNQEKNYDFCLHDVSTTINNKNLCNKIKSEKIRNQCLNYFDI
ncbi:hypothetical protein KJ671_03160 [Patescibacteria group bacterium]|nr:hypothetical protein [Patescibacteria group bacterium]